MTPHRPAGAESECVFINNYKLTPMTDSTETSYKALHRPSSEFARRQDYLDYELSIMNPKRWGINLPYRDYRFEFEDWVPAVAATIGKIVMVALWSVPLPHRSACLTALSSKTPVLK